MDYSSFFFKAVPWLLLSYRAIGQYTQSVPWHFQLQVDGELCSIACYRFKKQGKCTSSWFPLSGVVDSSRTSQRDVASRFIW